MSVYVCGWRAFSRRTLATSSRKALTANAIVFIMGIQPSSNPRYRERKFRYMDEKQESEVDAKSEQETAPEKSDFEPSAELGIDTPSSVH